LELASEAVLAVVAVIVAALIVGLLACLIIHVGGSLAEMQGLGWVP
jgi:archaellum component FlaG (FlaF/FlaG flagellin family)